MPLVRAAAQEWRRRKAKSELLPFCEALYGHTYKRAAHVMVFCEKLEALERGDIDRLAVSMPPRHSKTQTAKAFVAWCLGKHPDWQIIHATATQDLSTDMGSDIRDMVADEEYQGIFPGTTLREDSQASRRFRTNGGGIYLAVGTGTRIQGRGANLLLIDDPVGDPADADSEKLKRRLWHWYTTGAYSRLMPNARIVIIHTRWREDDLIGRVVSEHKHEGWEVLNFPAILDEGKPTESALWPNWFTLESLKRTKGVMSSRDWQALYMGRPTAEEGGILKRAWWKRWTIDVSRKHGAEPEMAFDEVKPPACDYVLISMDTAFSEESSADYSAVTVWGYFRSHGPADETKAPKVSDNIILLDAWHDRVDYPDLRAKALAFIKQYKPDTLLIEKKASGPSLIQELRRQRIAVVAYQPDRDKVARAYAVQSVLESGAVWVPDKKAWADMVVDECAAFPTGANDDLVDTVTQALLHFRQSGLMEISSDGREEPEPEKVRKETYSPYA